MLKNKLSVLTGLILLLWLTLGAYHAEPVSIGAAHLEENTPLMFIENVGSLPIMPASKSGEAAIRCG